ncbi:hypothetical protein [Methylobacterium oryzihabitans]|uniref:Uncharacterized protein n=1 Tax=Methylobacterium oryzihabitans TaxID=2499852 RepID=A0A3S2VHI0_9HYPH|nr:hypothetical protein [Methylobacterium oryzihabitans]RVU13191.1 hypothetical protein EOE48_26840 [Methylobacterium oryzihabitans]
MHDRAKDQPTPEIERIAAAYVQAAQGNLRAALGSAIADALADLAEAERRSLQRDRLISRGYMRSAMADVGEAS